MKLLITALFLLNSTILFADSPFSCPGGGYRIDNLDASQCAEYSQAGFGLTATYIAPGSSSESAHCCIKCAQLITGPTDFTSCTNSGGYWFPTTNNNNPASPSTDNKCCRKIPSVSATAAATRPVCPIGTTWAFVTSLSQCSTAPMAIPPQTYADGTIRCCKNP